MSEWQTRKECPQVSLQTIVHDGLAARLGPRSEAAAADGMAPPVRLSGMSMRVLETGLAFIAIVTGNGADFPSDVGVTVLSPAALLARLGA